MNQHEQIRDEKETREHGLLKLGLEDDTVVEISMTEKPDQIVMHVELRFSNGKKSEQVWLRIDRLTGAAISMTSEVARPGLSG